MTTYAGWAHQRPQFVPDLLVHHCTDWLFVPPTCAAAVIVFIIYIYIYIRRYRGWYEGTCGVFGFIPLVILGPVSCFSTATTTRREFTLSLFRRGFVHLERVEFGSNFEALLVSELVYVLPAQYYQLCRRLSSASAQIDVLWILKARWKSGFVSFRFRLFCFC